MGKRKNKCSTRVILISIPIPPSETGIGFSIPPPPETELRFSIPPPSEPGIRFSIPLPSETELGFEILSSIADAKLALYPKLESPVGDVTDLESK
jgi:hypothetical protein